MASSEVTAGEDGPDLPPLLRGEAADDPMAAAIAAARGGTDPGLVTHRIRPDRLTAALVLAPELPLGEAMAAVLAAANGFGDAFGALAPSEVGCEFDWPGGFRINGAACGGLRAAASTGDPAAEPDWMVIGLDVPFFAEAGEEPGLDPDRTTLWEEGCAEIAPVRLLESWSRHSLVWLHELVDAGPARLHRDWTGRAASIGEAVTLSLGGERHEGVFQGMDERGGMLLKTAAGTRLLPLTLMLEV